MRSRKGAGEGVAKTQNSIMCATQDEAGARNIDRGKTDAGAVEPRSDQRLAGEKWRPFDQPRAHLPACLGRQEKRRNLYVQLRHHGKKYNKRKGKTSGRGLIPNRVDIDQRPAIVAEKSRIGDWEADTIIGAGHQGAIMSHVERKSKYTKLAKLPDNSANSVVKASRRILLPLASRVETITYDNGKEFASHAEIVAALGAKSYFAKPYHSWERGLNEHTNGLFRQYFPKGTDFSTLSNADVQRVENKLNSRPRKILGYQTPREVFLIAA